MVSRVIACWVVGLVLGQAWCNPVSLLPSPGDQRRPLSDLTSHLGSHSSRLQDARLPIPGLPNLPSSQDLEAIKKVADILVMLGQQVIPAIIGESPSPSNCEPGDDTPSDPVNLDKQA